MRGHPFLRKSEGARYVCGRNTQEFGEDRCPHQPRSFRAGEVDNATITALMLVFTRDYLSKLAAGYIGESRVEADDTTVRKLRSRLGELHREKKAIGRKLAGQGNLDFLEESIADIEVEESAIQTELTDMELRASQQLQADTIEQQIEMLVDGAEDRLANLTTSEMAELFDLLELDLVRVDAHRFEGTASIPVPPDGGEIWKEGPQPQCPHRLRIRNTEPGRL